MAQEKPQNLQDTFLNHVRKQKVPVTVFLVNGVKLQGVITWFDNFCVLLRRDGMSQLVYKHAISTIMPAGQSACSRKRARVSTKRSQGHGVNFQIEGPQATRAIVVHVERKKGQATGTGDRDAESRLEEAVGLAEAIDLEIAQKIIVPLSSPRPATLIGAGKVEELTKMVEAEEAELVIVNAQLSPIQQRNLEKEEEWKAKVLDRTGLILEIFGRRAQTREGKLAGRARPSAISEKPAGAVMDPSRATTGGFGFLGGLGESQLEGTDGSSKSGSARSKDCWN